MNASSISHFIATLLSVAGLAVLVTFAAKNASAAHVVSFSIFGASLVLLYLASTLNHLLPKGDPRKGFFQALDHSMIYVLIAGTYTPLALLILAPAWGWSIFGVIWGLASIGIVLKMVRARMPKWFLPSLYLLMGWLIMVAFVPLRAALPPEGILWLAVGGIFYTIGVVFFVIDTRRTFLPRFSFHDVFHVLVILGSLSHFWFMLRYALPV